MDTLKQSFSVKYHYSVHFTQGIFKPGNSLLADILKDDGGTAPRKVFFIIDKGVVDFHPYLIKDIPLYSNAYKRYIDMCAAPVVWEGGEKVKNESGIVQKLMRLIEEHQLCRHSYLAVIGGGALLDAAGFVAAIAHRGIRLIRIPTTVLSQNDSGVGVKNGINAFGKKNFIGTFAPPFAVINDSDFLTTLDDRDWKGGIAEAVKVALIKDNCFFRSIEDNICKLLKRDTDVMNLLIHRCAKLHMEHISGRDPFEQGSSRPLDFGHWAAHKLEQLSENAVRHGEAVAIGIALDCTYSYLKGYLPSAIWMRIMNVLRLLKFCLYHPLLEEKDDSGTYYLIKGVEEFREHLGGELTIMLLENIGKGREVNEMDESTIVESVKMLHHYSKSIAELQQKV